jgi:hypothetical protein
MTFNAEGYKNLNSAFDKRLKRRRIKVCSGEKRESVLNKTVLLHSINSDKNAGSARRYRKEKKRQHGLTSQKS